MADLSKESVARAIAEKNKKASPDPAQGVLGKLRGMLNPRSGPGAIASREEYLKYVDERQTAGRPALSYDDWAKNR